MHDGSAAACRQLQRSAAAHWDLLLTQLQRPASDRELPKRAAAKGNSACARPRGIGLPPEALKSPGGGYRLARRGGSLRSGARADGGAGGRREGKLPGPAQG